MAAEKQKTTAELAGFPPEVLQIAIRYTCLHVDVVGSTPHSDLENTEAAKARNAWIEFVTHIMEKYGGRCFILEGDGAFFLFWKSIDDPFNPGSELSSTDACVREGIECLTGLPIFNTQFNQSSQAIRGCSQECRGAIAARRR